MIAVAHCLSCDKVCNVLDAPRSISLSQLFRTIGQWAAWSWGGGPGAILGVLACIVAFSSTPALPREPEQGPPMASDPMNREDDEDDDDNDNISALPDANALTFEKLQVHAKSESSGSRNSRTKGTSSKSGAAQSSRRWRIPLPTLERSHFSRASSSRNVSAASDISTTPSQGWSPYQVSLNTATLVTRSPARQFAVSDFYHAQTSDEPIRLPPKAAYSHQIPQQNSFRTKVEKPMKLYPLPVQVPRSELQEYTPPSSPLYEAPETTHESHFDAIHRLRDR